MLPLTADLLLLALISLLLSVSARRLHYRDAPYLLSRRWILRGSLSLLLHGAVLVCIWLMLLELYSAAWWAAVAAGSLPVALALRYAIQVMNSPRKVVERNKREWKGPELVP
ncbi:hypothetical protein [Deinococcus alpinitundrae]|uniref:hypothetical protein n=1 Tax=Deinococcus alpinitundrae TaxID=468913 RepID=UPI00137A841D|nr:hypothetical protein [Deinococcus alpinitundrae]